MSRRILVTGATGETGRYTTDPLISHVGGSQTSAEGLGCKSASHLPPIAFQP